MRIGVNLLPLVPGKVGGVKQLALGLLEHLFEVDNGCEYVCFVNRHAKNLVPVSNGNVRVVQLPWASKEIEARYRHGEFDVLFAPIMETGVGPSACPLVVLLVDLQHEELPQNFPPNEISRRRLKWEAPARSAYSVCVISEFTGQNVAKHLSIPPQRILLTPPPVARSFLKGAPELPDGAYRETIGGSLPERFFLYPSNTWPHKNHARLLEALSQVRTRHDDVHLVLTGWAHGEQGRIRQAVKRLELANSVTWLGYLDDEWMPFLYRDATALVFPSLYEGFGIPLLEAMYSDCPIACSNTTSCPEVAGPAAIYFDPRDVDEMSAAMESLWTSEQRRHEVVEAGKRQRERFEPRTVAQQLSETLIGAARSWRDPLRWRDAEPIRGSDEPTPLVSVVVPSYQQGRFVKRCVDSILDQDYPSLECIVVDGGSRDETIDVLQSYGDRIRWVSEPDEGQAHAVNKGFEMARGDIVGWLNSDDEYRPGALRRAVQALCDDTGSWLVYGEADYIDEDGKFIDRYATDTYSTENLLRHCCICQPAVFFRRKLLEIGGGLDQSYDMAMDYELWLRYSRITNLRYIPEVLACSRAYLGTKTSLRKPDSIREAMRACRHHYRRTSPLWCMQYARALAESIPLVGRRRATRIPFQAVILGLALLRNEVPGMMMDFARSVVRSLK